MQTSVEPISPHASPSPIGEAKPGSLGALSGALALHAFLLAALLLSRPLAKERQGPESVVVNLVSSAPPSAAGARGASSSAQPLDAFASEFAMTTAEPAKSHPTPKESAASLSQLMGQPSADPAQELNSVGEETSSNGGGGGEVDPYARASIPRVTDSDGLRLTAQLSQRAQRCWTSSGSHTRVTLSIVLDERGRLLGPPAVIGYQGPSASTGLGQRATEAVSACAPYLIKSPGRRSGRFELILE